MWERWKVTRPCQHVCAIRVIGGIMVASPAMPHAQATMGGRWKGEGTQDCMGKINKYSMQK